jgi:hypothetical protein
MICPNCKLDSPEWIKSEVYCEDCGDHPAVRCPKCEETYDHVWGEDALLKANPSLKSGDIIYW